MVNILVKVKIPFVSAQLNSYRLKYNNFEFKWHAHHNNAEEHENCSISNRVWPPPQNTQIDTNIASSTGCEKTTAT